jgi:hypothetical protein
LICERGVLVDEWLQTSAPGVYALGDGAQYAQGRWGGAADITPRGGRTLPFVMPIMSAARALAATLVGQAHARGLSADAGGDQDTGLADRGGWHWHREPLASGAWWSQVSGILRMSRDNSSVLC